MAGTGALRLSGEFQAFPRNSWVGEGSQTGSETEFTALGKEGTRVHLSLF